MFEITREDGRSNQQVIVDTVSKGVPGDVFGYDTLADELNWRQTPKTRRRVQQVVRLAMVRLLREFSRTLVCVPNVGYQVVPADQHTTLARTRERRADVQLRRGVQILQNVKWDELDANTKAAHEGHLMVTQSIYAMVSSMQKRQQSRDRVIKDLLKRVEKMEDDA